VNDRSPFTGRSQAVGGASRPNGPANGEYQGSIYKEYGHTLSGKASDTLWSDFAFNEALWFALNCAKSVESKPELNVVVIAVDSDSLETRCRFWLENNKD
jgi:hypothetical protein